MRAGKMSGRSSAGFVVGAVLVPVMVLLAGPRIGGWNSADSDIPGQEAIETTLSAASERPEGEDRSLSPLRVRGNALVTDAGEEVWLQGINVPSLEWSAEGENVLRSAKVAVRDWGANVIRLPVSHRFWFGEDGSGYRELIQKVVEQIANDGAYVILDLHHYRAVTARDLAFWREAAFVFKNHPAVIFDILNEPHGISWEVWRDGGWVEPLVDVEEDFEGEGSRTGEGFHSPGMQAVVEVIRATGAGNVLIAGGLDWAYDLRGIREGYALEDPSGRGIVYATHVYPWKRDWEEMFLETARLYPVIVSEVGADDLKVDWLPPEAQEDPATWVPDFLGLVQNQRLHWVAWCFHPEAWPRMLQNWDYEPTPFWGEPVRRALGGEGFELGRKR